MGVGTQKPVVEHPVGIPTLAQMGSEILMLREEAMASLVPMETHGEMPTQMPVRQPLALASMMPMLMAATPMEVETAQSRRMM